MTRAVEGTAIELRPGDVGEAADDPLSTQSVRAGAKVHQIGHSKCSRSNSK